PTTCGVNQSDFARSTPLGGSCARSEQCTWQTSRRNGLTWKRATHGMDEAMIAAIREEGIRTDERIIARATAQRIAVQVPDLLNEPLSLVLNLVIRAGYRALLVVPLLRPGAIIGTLVVRRKQPGEFPKSTVDLLETFADQSVLALQNARLFREIEEKGR